MSRKKSMKNDTSYVAQPQNFDSEKGFESFAWLFASVGYF